MDTTSHITSTQATPNTSLVNPRHAAFSGASPVLAAPASPTMGADLDPRRADGPLVPPSPDLLARKAQVMRDFHAAYAALKTHWAEQGAPSTRYDRWVAKANNASFGMQAVYHGWVPAFEALFAQEGHNWPRFYAAAQAIAQRPRAERDAALRALVQAAGAH